MSTKVKKNNSAARERARAAKKTGASSVSRAAKRMKTRFGPFAVLVSPPRESFHSPLPMTLLTRFTASGYFFTGIGTGTGDYNWTFPLNYCLHPFAAVTTGVTWGGLTPSTYNAIGYDTLLNGSLYTRCLVYDTLLELDIIPQSVTDSVFLTCTPSDQSGAPSSVIGAQPLPFTKQMTFASGRTSRFGDFPFKYRFSGHKLAGLPNTLYDANLANFNHFYNGNPGVPYYLVVNVETGDDSTLTAPLEIRVRQTFWVKLFEMDVSAMVSLSLGTSRRQARSEAFALARQASLVPTSVAEGKRDDADPSSSFHLCTLE